MCTMMKFNSYFLGDHPLSRYITTNQYTNLETVLIYQLVAYLGANNQDDITNYVSCDDCYNKFDEKNQVGTPDMFIHAAHACIPPYM